MAKDLICGMSVNETQGLKFSFEGKDYYFCSRHCLENFLKEKNLDKEKASSCIMPSSVPFYKNKAFIVAAVLSSVVLASYFVTFLVAFRMAFLMYLKMIWWGVLLGLFLGGVIDHFVPKEYISHILSSPKKRTIFYSAFLGFFMSACSHGILALSIELHKKGASNPAVVAFLLASPWANMAITIMLLIFFGLKALFIIVAALFVAITTGLIFQMLERFNLIETNKNILSTKKDFSIVADIKKRISRYRLSKENIKSDMKGIYDGMLSLGDMVVWWIMIGVGIASLAGAYIPSHIFRQYMGPTLPGLFVTLLLATVVEVCSSGSSPLAFEIYKQTRAFGNSFVFLMAGVVTDYTEIGLLWHNVGKKTAIWLPIVTVPQVVLLGFIANKIF